LGQGRLSREYNILIVFSNIIQKEKNGGGYGGGNKRGGGGGGGGRDNPNFNDYSQQQPQQPSYGQPAAASLGAPMQAGAPTQEAGAVDPYAIYGGYQNYLAMWYSSIAQQQQQGGQGPPGA
jgi:far upstream element-binding protein